MLAQESAGTGEASWELTDNQGSVVDVVDNATGGSAVVLDHIVYDSYGNIQSQSNAASDVRQGFTGYLQDAATGLDYANARWYQPLTGSFISVDPSGFGSGTYNLYGYVNQAPTNGTDPTGLNFVSDWKSLGGAGGNGMNASSTDSFGPGITPPTSQSSLGGSFSSTVDTSASSLSSGGDDLSSEAMNGIAGGNPDSTALDMADPLNATPEQLAALDGIKAAAGGDFAALADGDSAQRNQEAAQILAGIQSLSHMVYGDTSADTAIPGLPITAPTALPLDEAMEQFQTAEKVQAVLQDVGYRIALEKEWLNDPNIIAQDVNYQADMQYQQKHDNLEADQSLQRQLLAWQGGGNIGEIDMGFTQAQADRVNRGLVAAGLGPVEMASPEASSGTYLQTGLLLATGTGGAISMYNAATWQQFAYGTALTAWSADNLQATFTQTDPYLVQGIDWATGTTGVGSKVNTAVGLGLMIQAPAPYGWGRPTDLQPLYSADAPSAAYSGWASNFDLYQPLAPANLTTPQLSIDLSTVNATGLEASWTSPLNSNYVGTAYSYYTGAAGMSATDAALHMEGIDFSQPVTVGNVQPFTVLQQYVGSSGVGRYFAPLNTTALQAGIDPTNRTLQFFQNIEPTPALQSTNAPGYLYRPGIGVTYQPGAGGGTQYFVPDRGTFSPFPGGN